MAPGWVPPAMRQEPTSRRMRWAFRTFNRLLTLLVGHLMLMQTSSAYCFAQKPSDVTVRDAVDLVRLGDPDYYAGAKSGDNVAHFSPDLQYFVIVLRKANIHLNVNSYTVWCFQTKRLKKPPVKLLQMSTGANSPAIEKISWSSDSRQVVFLGREGSRPAQIFSVNVVSKRLRKLTQHPTSIVAYSLSPLADHIAFLAEPKLLVHLKPNPLLVVTNESLLSLIKEEPDKAQLYPELFIKSGNSERRLVANQPLDSNLVSVSPNDRYVVYAIHLLGKELLPAWRAYQFAKGAYAQSMFGSEYTSQPTPFTKYMVFNLRTHEKRAVWSGPRWFTDTVAWSADSAWLSMKNSYLPVAIQSEIASEERLIKPFTVNVHMTEARWTVSAKGDSQEPQVHPPLEIRLREDIDTPAQLEAVDRNTHSVTELMTLNPQLKDLRLGNVELFSWTVHGVEVTGGLYLPPDFTPHKRYPLVIQTHGFDPNRFSMDGRNEWSSGFAARPLASRGIVVLQAYVFKNPQDHDRVGKDKALGQTQEEAFRTFATLAYEGAIDALNRRGMIDPENIGISGFSRTVWFVAYTLTHSCKRFKAAILTDGIDAGYFQYLAFKATEFNADNGGASPFNEPGLEAWLKESPGFNLGKINTPIRLVSFDTGVGLLQSWEWYMGLKLQNKPVELVALADGSHLLERPRDRVLVMDGIVDWFTFWLLHNGGGKTSEKTEQDERWQKLRSMAVQPSSSTSASCISAYGKE